MKRLGPNAGLTGANFAAWVMNIVWRKFQDGKQLAQIIGVWRKYGDEKEGSV